MKFKHESGRWFVEVGSAVTPIEKFLASLMNKDLPQNIYVVASDMDDSCVFTPMSFYEDPRYPNGALNSPFSIGVYNSDDGQGALRFFNINNRELADDLKSKLAELGFTNVLIAPSAETVKKIITHFGD